MVHLLGSLAPTKSGGAVGVGPAARTVGPDSQNAIENKTAARMSSADPQIPRKNCVPFVTVSNFFIKTIPLCKGQVSYWGVVSVNRNKRGVRRHYRRGERATGIEPAWPAWKAGTLPLSYARAKGASPARTKLARHHRSAKRFLVRQQPLDI